MDYLISEPQPGATLHFLLKGGVSGAYNFARHIFFVVFLLWNESAVLLKYRMLSLSVTGALVCREGGRYWEIKGFTKHYTHIIHVLKNCACVASKYSSN